MYILFYFYLRYPQKIFLIFIDAAYVFCVRIHISMYKSRIMTRVVLKHCFYGNPNLIESLSDIFYIHWTCWRDNIQCCDQLILFFAITTTVKKCFNKCSDSTQILFQMTVYEMPIHDEYTYFIWIEKNRAIQLNIVRFISIST